ncbi:3-deoxy-manno-octulosonate cytidylyltransferase [Caulobacter sp. ErkDOM-E]|uniref:3-deoxy-manno-octulosonate cytidylyltransferase n=1 Tax=Caulobacter sp. ErkDOM-E TaxID=3402778 RepID=UPI003AF6EA05
MPSDTLVVIPARLAASRLSGKPLATIGDAPMIVHAWRQAVAANLGPVIVAAGDQEIVDAVESFGGAAILTDPALPSGTDRVWSAVQAFDPNGRFSMVVNVQGDMPFVDPGVVGICGKLLLRPDCDISTAAARDDSAGAGENANTVKVILSSADEDGSFEAIYFTRSNIYEGTPILKHVGIYGFKRSILERFCELEPSPLERRDSLEQLRAISAGMRIRAAEVEGVPISVDTAEDLELARREYDRLQTGNR